MNKIATSNLLLLYYMPSNMLLQNKQEDMEIDQVFVRN